MKIIALLDYAEKIFLEELQRNKQEPTFGDSRSHLHLLAGASVQGFIVDFYCHKSALVIEVDGDIHDLQKEEDERREKALSALGLRIVRFRNDEVMRGLSAVVGKIRELI
jgi:very-short-patch-repair endonuclease